MFNRLRLKVTIGTALILGLVLVVLGSHLIQSQERQLVDNLRDHGERIAALAARSSAEYIQRFSFFLMEDQAIAIEQSPHIAFCEIYDANGKPLLQSGNIISKDHSGKHKAHYDTGVMVVSQPIMAGGKVLGKVEVGLLMDSIEETMREKKKHMVFLFTGFTLGIVALLNIFFTKIFITPVRKLEEGTRRVADRQFITIDVGKRSDEIGQLARNFNDMSLRLKDLYNNLEDKVGQRTMELEQANTDLLAAIDHARAMARKAEEGTMAKSQFLASMSHEMRTPMNAVLGMGEILNGTALDDEQRRYVSVLLESGNALLNLIDDILDLSKIEAGEMVFEKRTFSLEEAVDKSFKIASYAGHRKGLDLDYSIAPDVPAQLVGDPLRLQQILINLLGNGVKFTDYGSVLLDVRVDARDTDELALTFCVKDTGIGIETDKVETIFEKFTQADASTTRRHGGTGLGLSICQLLCEKLGGLIWIESVYGKGCSVYFTLPFEPAPDEKSASPLAEATMLMIDDREYADITLGARLRHAGAAVDTVPNLGSAFKTLRASRASGRTFDRILLNTPLDDMSWEKSTTALIETGIDPKSIFLLLPNDPAQASALEYFGAALTKPVSTREMEEAFTSIDARFNTPHAARDDAQPARSLNILLVEDSVANALLIELYLKDTNHNLTQASNGEEALNLFKEHRFDLVLMDIEMPIMDGYECTKELRAWEKENDLEPVAVVALSAHALSEVRDRILAAGCDTFLTKPIARTDFLDVVNRGGRS